MTSDYKLSHDTMATITIFKGYFFLGYCNLIHTYIHTYIHTHIPKLLVKKTLVPLTYIKNKVCFFLLLYSYHFGDTRFSSDNSDISPGLYFKSLRGIASPKELLSAFCCLFFWILPFIFYLFDCLFGSPLLCTFRFFWFYLGLFFD